MEEKKKKKNEFEFCKVCRFHHDHGPRHKYFPRHKELLSAFLNRFRSKIADVRFFLKNPSFLRPQEESQNRVWCVFCDEDIVELGSSFAWYNIPVSFPFDLSMFRSIWAPLSWMWNQSLSEHIIFWYKRNRNKSLNVLSAHIMFLFVSVLRQ